MNLNDYITLGLFALLFAMAIGAICYLVGWQAGRAKESLIRRAQYDNTFRIRFSSLPHGCARYAEEVGHAPGTPDDGCASRSRDESASYAVSGTDLNPTGTPQRVNE